MKTHLRARERHLPKGITWYYLPPDTGEGAPLKTGRYSIYVSPRDGRLS